MYYKKYFHQLIKCIVLNEERAQQLKNQSTNLSREALFHCSASKETQDVAFNSLDIEAKLFFADLVFVYGDAIVSRLFCIASTDVSGSACTISCVLIAVASSNG